MTKSILDKIGIVLFPDERVLWSRIQAGVSEKTTPKWISYIIYGIIIIFWVYQYLTSDLRLDWMIVLGGVGFIAVIVLTMKFGPDVLKRLRIDTDQTDFMSCVITTDRVLLLDYEGAPVTALDRRSLKPAVVDFVRGGRAIIFRSHTDTRDHAFIANTNFKPALEALDTPRNTP